MTYFLQFKETKEVVSVVYGTWKILLTEIEKEDKSGFLISKKFGTATLVNPLLFYK